MANLPDGEFDIARFERVIEQLNEGLVRYRADTTHSMARDGLVQRFDRAYDLGHKTLRRYLKYASANPDQFDEMTFPNLIRTANEQALLLGDWPKWEKFREMRVKAGHAYDDKIALEVVAGIPRFLEEATYLRDRLKERLA